MADTLIVKLKSLPDSQLFEAIASRDLLRGLQNKLRITPDKEYSPERLIVEIISDSLKSAIADGLNRLDVVAFYHVIVGALDCCATYDNTDEAVKHFIPLMSKVKFGMPHATSIVEHHVITIFQHFYLYHHIMTEVQQVDVSNTLVTCYTPTHHPILKEAVQEDEWNRLSQISSLEKTYAEKRKELEEATNVSCDPALESHDQVLTREGVEQVTQQLLGNIIDMTKRNIEHNIKGQELTVDLASEKIKVLANRPQPNSLPPSRNGAQASSGGVRFDPDLVTSQLHDVMDDEDLLSDDDFFSNASSEDDEEVCHVMQQMDKELANTTMAKSFDRVGQQEQQQEEGEELKPVDIDFNLVKNLLESYTSQEGGAGPTSNILQSMGIKMPDS